MDKGIGFLDLHKEELMGWERDKSALVVAAMIEGIKLGHKFPAVDIVIFEGKYYLASNRGGHNRAVSHYIERVPLRRNLWDCQGANIVLQHGGNWSPIKDHFFPEYFRIFKMRVSEIKAHESQIRKALSYLPENIAENFCRENNLDVNTYLSQ